jgi:hypothetical protein
MSTVWYLRDDDDDEDEEYDALCGYFLQEADDATVIGRISLTLGILDNWKESMSVGHDMSNKDRKAAIAILDGQGGNIVVVYVYGTANFEKYGLVPSTPDCAMLRSGFEQIALHWY